MSAITPLQSQMIAQLVTLTRSCSQELADAVKAAMHADKDDLAVQLLQPMQDAIDLKAAALNLATVASLDALKSQTADFQLSAKKLNDQRAHMEAMVKDVAVVATVLSTLAQIAKTASSLGGR